MVEGTSGQQAAVSDQAIGDSAAGPELARRGAKHVPASPIELANAAEARGKGDVRDRQVGVVEESAGEMGPPRAGKLIRRHAHVLEEQPTQMPSGDEQARAQIFLGLAVEGPVHDELYSPTDQIRTAPADP